MHFLIAAVIASQKPVSPSANALPHRSGVHPVHSHIYHVRERGPSLICEAGIDRFA
jgi:hypothetical protein